MSLIAWYPLNGNILDYSGNNNHLIYKNNSGKITVNNSGKIGKCMQRTVVNDGMDYLISSNTINLNGDFTITCWANVSDCHSGTANGIITNHNHYSNLGAGINIREVSSNDYRISCNTGNGYSRTFYNYYGITNIKNKWSHLLLRFIKNKNQLSLWVNGVKEFETNYDMMCTSDRIAIFAWSTGYLDAANYRPACRVNDVRIYDNALSEKEIKDLSKAKILHYKCNYFQEPTKNLWSGSLLTYNNFKVPSSLTKTNETYNGQPIYRLAMTVDDINASYLSHFKSMINSHGVYGGRMIFNANTKYAASIFWKPVNKLDTIVGGTASNIGGWSALPNEELDDGWFRYTQIRNGTAIENKTDSVFFSFICPSLNLNETIYIDFCCPQIEEGKDYVTPYTTSVRESTIKDVSGYNNDGYLELLTSPKWVKNSKIGSGAYEFDVINKITTNKLFFDNNNQCWTVMAWVYLYDNSYTQYLNNFNLGNRIIHSNNKKALLYINDGANDSYTYSSGTIPQNEWIHISFVLDTSIQRCQIYLNGNLYGSSTNYASIDSPRGFIDNTIFGENFIGLMSDIRVYAVALSQTDIKEIYEVKTCLDNQNNFYNYEIIENKNIAYKVNDAISKKIFAHGLSSYTQSNCQVTLTDNGYRIYRPPNLNYPAAGNTMWGGLKINLFNINPNILQKGHKYKISFNVSGVSSNSVDKMYFSNQMGWGGGGLTSVPALEFNTLESNFSGSKEIYAIFHITDDIWKICKTTYSNFIEGQYYNCYRDLCWGFQYTNTGELGTNLYITDFKLLDITDNKYFNISEKGIVNVDSICEVGITKGLIGWWPLNGHTKDYSINNNHGVNNGAVVTNGLDSLAYNFNYTTDNILIGDSNKFKSDYVTISVLVNSNDIQADQNIISRNAPYFLRIINSKLRCGIYTDSQWKFINSTSSLLSNIWYHLVLTFDGKNIRGFINGTEDLCTDKAGMMTQFSNCYIGYTPVSGENAPFNGKIQDVRIYNRALSPDEIKILYKTYQSNLIMQIHQNGTLYLNNDYKEV